MSNGTVLPLHDIWTLYWHPRSCQDWSLESYSRKAELRTVPDFWKLYNNFRTVAHDMFFLMRQGHPPLWEDAKNIKGGALSFKIHNKEVDNFWLVASMLLVGESICQCPEELTGISVSPKLQNPTIRVWFRDPAKLDQIQRTLHPELLRISSDFIVRHHSEPIVPREYKPHEYTKKNKNDPRSNLDQARSKADVRNKPDNESRNRFTGIVDNNEYNGFKAYNTNNKRRPHT